MNDQLEIPKFSNEAQEADWWFENRDQLADYFAKASREGRFTWGSAVLRRISQREGAGENLTIQVSAADRQKIRGLATEQGQDDATYTAALVHDMLSRISEP